MISSAIKDIGKLEAYATFATLCFDFVARSSDSFLHCVGFIVADDLLGDWVPVDLST